MGALVEIFADKKLIATADGSFTFYSLEYEESYKTKSSGAYTESLHKFVNASGIVEKLRKSDVRLLDICFGAGMNLAATINSALQHKVNNRLHAVSVEKDAHLFQLVSSCKLLLPPIGYSVLRDALGGRKHDIFSLELYLSDAREFLGKVGGKFDVIYFDPFSKKHNPEMWTLEIFKRLYNLLDNNGCLVTYASSKTIKDDFALAGFKITEISSIGRRNHPSIMAKKI